MCVLNWKTAAEISVLYVYQTIRQQGRCLSCVSIKPKTTQEISVLYVYQTITKQKGGLCCGCVSSKPENKARDICVICVPNYIRQPGRHFSSVLTKLEDLTRGILFMFVPDYDIDNKNNNNSIDCIERYISICYFLQSPHCAMNCLQHVRSSGQDAIPLQCIGCLCAIRCVPRGTKGQLSC